MFMGHSNHRPKRWKLWRQKWIMLSLAVWRCQVLIFHVMHIVHWWCRWTSSSPLRNKLNYYQNDRHYICSESTDCKYIPWIRNVRRRANLTMSRWKQRRILTINFLVATNVGRYIWCLKVTVQFFEKLSRWLRSINWLRNHYSRLRLSNFYAAIRVIYCCRYFIGWMHGYHFKLCFNITFTGQLEC